jgi:hypothetical protein
MCCVLPLGRNKDEHIFFSEVYYQKSTTDVCKLLTNKPTLAYDVRAQHTRINIDIKPMLQLQSSPYYI